MEFQEYLTRYASLIVRHGLNVQRGQKVNLAGEAAHREFLYLIARECYALGALYVNIDLIEPRLSRLRVESSTEEQMKYVPGFITPKYLEILESGGANLRIVGPEDPDILRGLDPKKINTGRIAGYQAIKPFYDDGIGKSKVHWTVAAAATKGWAKRIFPGEPEDRVEMLLWDQIFKICRVDHQDCLERWKKHNAMLQERARRLTDLRIKTLHFRGPGTDLRVGLSELALFKGGGDVGPHGVEYEPNIPTEECFTTPDWRLTEGRVRATRPFFINGTLIKGLEIEFKQGEIVSFEAAEGLETFREYIGIDPGGKRLGEVALVGIDSPVYQSGLVFEEILFDENAACHIAVGSAYKFCLKGGNTLSSEELSSIGCNESSVHTDMMISSEQVDVEAQTYDGRSVSLISRGQWTKI
ncbi:MAG: aminopeptidase [Proteobacteria bacterium]|nr:MAG: aminopeptidase [Pseudomonadota bacterium]